MQVESTLFTFPKYRPELTRPAPFLPMSRKEMAKLGWDSCDIIIVTGDAYVDHPSFGMAVIGRMLEVRRWMAPGVFQPSALALAASGLKEVRSHRVLGCLRR